MRKSENRPVARPHSTPTAATRAAGGPVRRSLMRDSIRSFGPSTSSWTRPSSRFRTVPYSPRATATRTANARYPTPCTLPVTEIVARTVTGSAGWVMDDVTGTGAGSLEPSRRKNTLTPAGTRHVFCASVRVDTRCFARYRAPCPTERQHLSAGCLVGAVSISAATGYNTARICRRIGLAYRMRLRSGRRRRP